MSKSLKDLTALIFSNALLKVLGIVSVVIYTRYLLKEELALVPLIAVLGRLSMVVFSFGILPTLVREVPHLIKEDKHDQVRSAVVTSLIIIVPGIFVFSLLCFLFSGYLSGYFLHSSDFTLHLQIMAAGVFFTGLNQAFSYIYWSLSRYQQESSRMVIVGVIQVVLSIAFVIWWGIMGLLIALILTSLVNTLLFIYNLKDILLVRSFTLYPVKKLIYESMPFYLESYLQYFRAEGDQLLVVSLMGPEALAVYFIAKKPYDVLHSFTQSLDKVLTTSLAKFKNDRIQFNQRVNSIITLNSYILFPLVFLIIGITPTFIVVLAGKGYESAIIPSIFLLLWLIAQLSWKTALGKSIFILKSSTGRFKVTLVETVTLISLMFLLGHFFSLNGIVVGRLLATILAGFFAFYLIKKDISIRIDLKSISAVMTHSIIMCLVLLTAQYVFSSYTVLFFSFLFAIIMFLFLINRTISDKFYAVLNSVSPVRIYDPFRYVYAKIRSMRA